MRAAFVVLALAFGSVAFGTAQAQAQAAGNEALSRFDAELKRLNAEAKRNRDAFIAEGEAERAGKAPRSGEAPLDASGADLQPLFGPESDWVERTHTIREVKIPETDCRYRRFSGQGDGDDYLRVEDRYLSCPVFKFELEGPAREPPAGGAAARPKQ